MKAYRFFLPLTAACLATLTVKAQVIPDDSEVVTTPVTTAAAAESQDSLKSTIEALTNEVAKMRDEKETREKKARAAATWNKSRPFTIAYENVSLTEEESGLEYKSKMAFALSKRRTYYVGPALFNMLRFGIDATWMDLSYAQFEKGKGVGGMVDGMTGNTYNGSYDNMDGYFNDAYDNAMDESSDGDDIMNRVSLGKHRIAFNLGVGPSVKIAPFTMLDNKTLNKLKVSGYFHWNPGYQALLFTGDELEVSHGALLRNFGIGVNLSFGRIGIGVEHRWGNSKMNNWQFDDEGEDEGDYDMPDYDDVSDDVEPTAGKKINYKHSITRFYIGFRF